MEIIIFKFDLKNFPILTPYIVIPFKIAKVMTIYSNPNLFKIKLLKVI